jgi:hypothetical protein
MDSCKICSNNFQESPDKILMCRHKEGMVHYGCCVAKCSMDGKPCMHKMAMYSKMM